MKVRFSVIRFLYSDARIFVCGSLPELGSWDPALALPLSCSVEPIPLAEPSFWSDVVDLDLRADSTFDYKFITAYADSGQTGWEGLGEKDNRHCDISSLSHIEHVDVALLNTSNDNNITKLTGSQLNRGAGDTSNSKFNAGNKNYHELINDTTKINFNATDNHDSNDTSDRNGNVTVPTNNAKTQIKDIPVTHWIEASGASNEFNHTTQFYFSIAERRDIHYSKITDRIYLGSCPRQPYHIALLRSIGISAILNFQLAHDIVNNSSDVFPYSEQSDERQSVPRRLGELYDRLGIAYVWMPTDDMSTEARSLMVPQAVFVLHGLLCQGHMVYVHCNAGVGRSTAAVAGYLHFILQMSLEQMRHFLLKRRPAVYIDNTALETAKPNFYRSFGYIKLQ